MGTAIQPPKGFRGVFLWVPDPEKLKSGTVIPADRLPAALAALAGPMDPDEDGSDGPAEPVEPDEPSPRRRLSPTVGIVVLGRWLGAKPGDSAWAVEAVEPDGDGFRVVFAGQGGLVLSVQGAGHAVLAPGPYGDLLVIASARSVLATESGEPELWLPSVRDGQAYDMRAKPQKWPHRRIWGERWPAPGQPVAALILSIWSARPLPADLRADG